MAPIWSRQAGAFSGHAFVVTRSGGLLCRHGLGSGRSRPRRRWSRPGRRRRASRRRRRTRWWWPITRLPRPSSSSGLSWRWPGRSLASSWRRGSCWRRSHLRFRDLGRVDDLCRRRRSGRVDDLRRRRRSGNCCGNEVDA